VVTVWAIGWRGRALAAPLVIELAYDLLLQIIFIKSLIDIAIGRKAGWNYVPREAAVQQ
jgi:biofilm PGA synthesis N-glycosyltransferase PgaC